MEGRDEQKQNKRTSSFSGYGERPSKRPAPCVNLDDDVLGVEMIYKFRVLLPNGMSLGLKIRDPETEMPLHEFVDLVRQEYFRLLRQTESQKPNRRRINWKSPELHFVDAFDNLISKTIFFKNFGHNKYIILTLHDGSGEAETYENMWDLTPDTELLMELPAEYTFETALADLIDNSLQAVWSNDANERRLISVEINDDKISIFDTGSGMDGSDENSIVKWGKMGASLHRSSRGHGMGGNPPYLMPFFGMFGYGGPIASMHLGRHALVSSKTKQSKKVYTLHLEREALLSSSGSEKTWRTDGGIRHPTEDEIRRSPQCSFTKVEIFEPKMKGLDIVDLQCKLKDIYFPYIQCDEVSCTGKTVMPIEFQVNGTDLAEIQSGEVAITNLHSCNGSEFVLQLHFSWDAVATSSPGVKASQEANARLKFIYFPIVEGKESIEKILEKLEADGCGITENFETFSRVSVRRLGRLLPDARWTWLPFMDRRQKKGDRAQILKRCCLRVKCFIDTDAGFNPTPSKTDLAHHHPCTTALKNFGEKPLEKGKEAKLRIYKDGKQVTLLQAEKLYQEWIFQMHDRYDEEIDSGVDQPLIVVSPSNKKGLRISSDVVRVHKVIQRKGSSWKSGQKIKVLKGACAGCHKNNMYATLEYILVEGFQGDSGGEARLICRPLGLPSENGCVLTEHNGNVSINICGSVSLPISVIDSGKCLAIETVEWEYHVEKQRQKMPSTIEILSARHCQELMIEEEFPIDTVYAGHVPPKEIVAVVRPASFNSASASKNLDQKYIVKENFEMCIQIKFRADDNCVQDVQHIYSGCTSPSSCGGFHGLYIFPLGCKFPDIFQKAGVYTFSLSLKGGNFRSHDRELKVKALSKVGSWGLLSDGQRPLYNVRVGLCFPPVSVGCYDIYGNRIPFASVPKVKIKIISKGWVLAVIHRMELNISLDKLTLEIKDILIEINKLDKIQPYYEATLIISSQDELFSVSVPCRVLPGYLQHISIQPKNLDQHLLPGHAIEELLLEMFDAFGNHVEEGLVVTLNVDGFCIQDHVGSLRKVDERGCIDLRGLLKVTEGYGKNVSFSVLLGEKILFKKVFETEKRELRAGSEVPKFCMAGSLLENLVFEIVNSEGDVDVSIHDEKSRGQFHMLTIKSESLDTDESLRYSFRHGRCIVRAISLPQKEGIVHIVASHLRHPELSLIIEVHVLQSPKVDPEGFQPQCTGGKVFLLQGTSSLKVPKVDHDDVHGPFSDGNVLLLQDSSTPDDVEDLLAVSILKDNKELEEDVLRYGLSVGNHEEALKMLNVRLTELKENVSTLQASLELNLFDHYDNVPGKEVMMKLIESKVDSAAAVVCRLLREIPLQEQQNNSIENILGVVALLGTVQNNELRRILAEYLGEDQMLAVVCKSYAAAHTLEKYEQNGNVDNSHAFHAAAAQVGQWINGRYLVICLEDIRPYSGELGSDPERKLSLPAPILPSGNTPSGFLGFAVNMINIDASHLHTRTGAGHGLRETLFYRLFGELQVYETRRSMEMAKACIKHGAVSLDGGIMRGNGVVSLGHRVFREQEILFPITAPRNQSHLSPHNMELLKQIEENKLELKEIVAEIEKETKTHRKILKKFRKKTQRYNSFLDKKGHLLKSLEYRLNTKNSKGPHC